MTAEYREEAWSPAMTSNTKDDVVALADELQELVSVVEAVRGDRGLLRVSGTRGDPQDVGVLGIKPFLDLMNRATAALRSSPITAPQESSRCASEAGDGVREVLEQAKAALIKIRTRSIAGCNEGYGKPEKWADDLFRSHGDVTKAIKAIDAALAPPARIERDGLREALDAIDSIADVVDHVGFAYCEKLATDIRAETEKLRTLASHPASGRDQS